MSWLKRAFGRGKEPEQAAPPAPEQAAAPAPAPAPAPANPAAGSEVAEARAHHMALTPARAAAYEELFGYKPTAFFASHELNIVEDDPIMIDVFIYQVETKTYGDIHVAVTNGMSDRRMVDPEDPEYHGRHELIQYLPRCTREHAKRLYTMAWIPHEDGFFLDTFHTVAWDSAAMPGTPWTNAIFIEPLLRSHREFEMTVEGEPVTLLWHVPISDKELEYKREHGVNALLDRMQEVELPWVFDEANRPPLVE